MVESEVLMHSSRPTLSEWAADVGDDVVAAACRNDAGVRLTVTWGKLGGGDQWAALGFMDDESCLMTPRGGADGAGSWSGIHQGC